MVMVLCVLGDGVSCALGDGVSCALGDGVLCALGDGVSGKEHFLSLYKFSSMVAYTLMQCQ